MSLQLSNGSTFYSHVVITNFHAFIYMNLNYLRILNIPRHLLSRSKVSWRFQQMNMQMQSIKNCLKIYNFPKPLLINYSQIFIRIFMNVCI